MNTLAVVILNHNGLSHLQSFLPGVIAASHPHEVVVVDNGSSDGSLEYLRSGFSSLRIIALEKNFGFCGGYNAGLKLIEADYYVLLNSDVEVGPGWIEPVVDVFKDDPKVAAVQPKMLTYDDRGRFEYAGAAGGFLDSWGYPFCRGRIFEVMEEDHGQYDNPSPTEIFWASGACLFIRSGLYHRFGGLDEDFFAHMEEIDLCWRLKNAGYRIAYTSHSRIYHVGGGTLPKHNPVKTYLNFRNALYLLLKNMPLPMLWWRFPVRIAIDYVAVLAFAFRGEYGNAWAVMKAHLSVARNGLKQLQKRRAHGVKLSELPGYYRGMILYQYHVLKNRRFSDLRRGISTK